jgi:hypothetical protein
VLDATADGLVANTAVGSNMVPAAQLGTPCQVGLRDTELGIVTQAGRVESWHSGQEGCHARASVCHARYGLWWARVEIALSGVLCVSIFLLAIIAALKEGK